MNAQHDMFDGSTSKGRAIATVAFKTSPEAKAAIDEAIVFLAAHVNDFTSDEIENFLSLNRPTLDYPITAVGPRLKAAAHRGRIQKTGNTRAGTRSHRDLTVWMAKQ